MFACFWKCGWNCVHWCSLYKGGGVQQLKAWLDLCMVLPFMLTNHNLWKSVVDFKTFLFCFAFWFHDVGVCNRENRVDNGLLN